MDKNRLRGVVESLLLVSDKPLSARDVRGVVEGVELSEVNDALESLAAEYARDERGFRLQEVAGGYQLRTHPANARWVRAIFAQKPQRLSRAALETLAIVAYKQPITRPEIEEIRGVDSAPVLRLLFERSLIRILGRKDEPGRPMLYGTTREFLEFFGLKDLTQLPTLRELKELMAEEHAGSPVPAAGGPTLADTGPAVDEAGEGGERAEPTLVSGAPVVGPPEESRDVAPEADDEATVREAAPVPVSGANPGGSSKEAPDRVRPGDRAAKDG